LATVHACQGAALTNNQAGRSRAGKVTTDDAEPRSEATTGAGLGVGEETGVGPAP